MSEKTKTTPKCMIRCPQEDSTAERSDACGLAKDHGGPHSWSEEWWLSHPYKPLLKVGDSFLLKRDWEWLKDGIWYEVEEIFPGPPDGSPMYRFAKGDGSSGTVYADLVDDEIRDGFAEAL